MSYSPTPASGPSDFLVADIDWLTPDLAVGGDLSHDPDEAAAQARWLERQGITTIIGCRGEYSDAELVRAAAPSIDYYHLPTGDHGGEMDIEWWESGITIDKMKKGPVFVRCHMGVNRGPSMAFAILVDRGMDPVAAFDLLRTRRPQAYAIYAPQFLRMRRRSTEAKILQAFMEIECDHDDLVATIGRIRRSESDGRYRFTLEGGRSTNGAGRPEESASGPTCDGACSNETYLALAKLMCEHKGFDSTEDPFNWVRSLMRKDEENRRLADLDLPVTADDLAVLSIELDAWLDEL